MGRTARGDLTGIHLQLLSGARVSDLGVRCFTVLDESAPFLPELRQRIPDARICLRLLQNSHWGDPEGTARAGAALVAAYPQADYLTPSNEDNLEHGASMAQIADWSRRFLDEWRRQGAPRLAVSPAISPGAPYDLAQLRDAWQGFPIIGVHAYWHTAGDASPALGMVTAHRNAWPDKPQWVGELNCGQPGQMENDSLAWPALVDATGRFMDSLAGLGYVTGATWFVDDSRDQLFRLVRIPPLMDLYRAIGHEQGGNPGPEPQPPSGIAAKYNLVVTETPYMGVRFEDVTDGRIELEALGPADVTVSLRTADGQHGNAGLGRAAVVMASSSIYWPDQGQHGPWVAECGGARVEGLGMMPSHEHPRTIFERGSTPPPSTGHTWDGAFGPYAAQHPEVGQPVGPNAYLPQDTQPWPCCAQLSRDWVLVWTGGRVHQLRRD